MKVAIAYHYPVALADRYAQFRKRFEASIVQFPPDYPHDLFVVNFDGLDIGSYIRFSRTCTHDFIVCAGATVYAHRRGWLKRLMEEVEKHGPVGLYTASASHEGDPNSLNPPPNPHARSSFFGCDPKALAAYPFEVNTREECYRFEGKDRKFGLYCKPVRLVTWTGVTNLDDCRKPPNCFRRGNQSDVLVWDGRTDEYKNANPAEKKRLENLADGSCMP